MTARVIRYRQIADELRSRIVAGEFAAGAVLPSEAALSDQYGASRVTIRRALDALRAEGIADARQGFGWYVAADPLRQELGALGTIEAQLRHAGVRSERRILSFGFIDAPDDIAAILGELRGKPVTYVDLTPEQQRAALEQQGAPGWMIDGFVGLEGVKLARPLNSDKYVGGVPALASYPSYVADYCTKAESTEVDAWKQSYPAILSAFPNTSRPQVLRLPAEQSPARRG